MPQDQNHYYNECHEGILEVGKEFLNILLDHLVEKTIAAAVKADVNEYVFFQIFFSKLSTFGANLFIEDRRNLVMNKTKILEVTS